MPSILGTSQPGNVPSVEDLMQMANGPTAQPAANRGGFRRILGGVVGAAANVFLPGVGGAISGLISGGSVLGNTAGSGQMTPLDMLQIQQQVEQEQEAFTLASTIMKDRHDAAMEAIRNSKCN